MMGIPERLEALLSNSRMGGSVHEEHDQQHAVVRLYTSLTKNSYSHMTCDSTRLGIMNLPRRLLADLCSLDIDEIDVVGGSMHNCPEEHLISDLAVELGSASFPTFFGLDGNARRTQIFSSAGKSHIICGRT